MNMRFALTVSLVVFLAALLSTASFAQEGGEWRTTTVDSAGRTGLFTSLAFGLDGQPAISYLDATNSQLKYAWRDHEGWQTSVADGEGEVGMRSSLAFDTDGQPAISYVDYMNWDLKHAWNDVDGWHTEIVDNRDYVRYATSLAFRLDGYPSISYSGGNGNDPLRYAWMDISGWNLEEVDSNSDVSGTSLAFNADGYGAIAYFDYKADDLLYAWQDESGWHYETVDSEGNVGEYPSLAFSPEGNPCISYRDFTDSALKFAWKDDSGWHFDVLDGAVDVVSSSLAFDPGGYPVVSYADLMTFDLKCVWQDAAGWHNVTVDSAGDVGTLCSLAFGPEGNPAISYFDDSNADLKLAEFLPYAAPMGQPVDYLMNFISFPLADGDQGFGDGRFDPTLVFAFEDLMNKLFRYNPVTKSWQIYDDDFDVVQVGRGYALYVFGAPLEPGYSGWPAPPGFKVNLPRLGFSLIGCAANEPTPMTDLRIQLHTDGEIRTAENDFDSPDPWLSWDWIYWDSVLDSYAICSFDGGDDDQLRPWFGYWVWQYMDDLWLLWP